MMPEVTNPGERALRTRGDAAWVRRRNIAFTIVCWLAIVGVALWAAAHVIHALLLLIIACLLAYALVPAVVWLTRWMPRWLALVAVYAVLLALAATFGYLLISATATQLSQLAAQVRVWLSPGANGAPSPITQYLRQLGLSQQQIDSISQEVVAQVQRLAGDVVPVLQGVANGVLDTVLVVVLSVYLLIDGQRINQWARTSSPRRIRPRVVSYLETLERVVGGYIRGQLLLAALVGVLVGVGMFAFRLPYALLLGVLAFVLEFIPIIGVLISGAVCVLIALTHGWLIALGVLIYFIVVHVIEGDVIGPRLVGHAVGLHPVVSIVGLIAGGELFGIFGALFAAPLAGLIQAVLLDLWVEWRKLHPEEFAEPEGAGADGGSVAAVAKAGADALAAPDSGSHSRERDPDPTRPAAP